jgi:DNA-binding winged helix-turn-helix (wHTH) protein/tetratricopeptide (TPR) repeat protein
MNSLHTDREVFRFEDCEFVVRDCELRRGGEVVPLARKPAGLLLLLLRHQGRFVSRDEILAALWPDVRVSEAAVSSVVRDLRRALHDEARLPRLVATSRGRGLRFLGTAELANRDIPTARDSYVGRSELLDRLKASVRDAIEGRGHLALLGGEAGIGKTRTAREIANYARGLGASTHFARVWPPGTARPYTAAKDLLTSIGGELGTEWSENLQLPTIARLLGPEPPIAENDQVQARFEAFDAVAIALSRAARIKPLVLTLDDLEYANTSALLLLEHVAARIAEARILILACYRTPALERGHPLTNLLPRLIRLPNVEQHLLQGLDVGETATLLESVVGREVETARIEALHRSTDGNPFLLGLLARSVPSSPIGGADGIEGVPAMLRDWIRGTLLSLPDESVDCLRAAAVLGREFRVPAVAAMVGRERHEVEEALAAARRAGLLATGGALRDGFAHGLLHEAVYADIPASLRVELHWRAADAVKTDEPSEALAAVAHHLIEAVEIAGESAVHAAERAADDAERRFDFEEAIRMRGLALRALDAIGVPAATQRCLLLLGRARAQLVLRRVNEAWDSARRAAALARQTGNIEHLAQTALMLSDHVLVDASEPIALLEEVLSLLPPGRSTLRARVACGLSQMLWYRGNSERRLGLAREALEIAREEADPRLEVAALLAERNALQAPEHLTRRLEVSNAALTIAERAGTATQRCLLLSWRAVDRLEAGDVIGAQLDVDAVSRVVEAGGARRLAGFSLRWAAMRAILAGRLAEAERHVSAARERMIQTGDPNAEAYAGMQGGILLLEQARSADIGAFLASAQWLVAYRERVPGMEAALSVVELETGVEGPARSLLEATRASDWARLRDDPEPLGTSSWLAEACARLEDSDFAAALYERLEPYGERICCFYAVACRGAVARYLGLLARTAGRFDEAERWFDKSIRINRALGADLYVAWSQWDWAESIARRGSPEAAIVEARRLAAEALRFAEEHGIGRLRAAQRQSRWSILLGVE